MQTLIQMQTLKSQSVCLLNFLGFDLLSQTLLVLCCLLSDVQYLWMEVWGQ